MARFYVGQRVRIKWSETWPELCGKEGTVVGVLSDSYIGGVWVGLGYPVAPDLWGGEREPLGTRRFGPRPEQLEPVHPEGWKKVEWSDCLWQPIKEAA